MAITQQVYEWDNLSTNSAGTEMGDLYRKDGEFNAITYECRTRI